MSLWDSLCSVVLFCWDFTGLCLKLVWIFCIETVRSFLPRRRKDLRDEIILITGSAQGIGRELAIKSAEQGAKVVLWDINEEKVQNVAAEIASIGGWVKWYKCDVTSEEDVNEKAKLVLQNVGDVDILLNNAGLMQNVPFLQLDSAKIRKTFEINIIAHIWTIRAFLPNMIKRNRGHVVAISSAAGLMGHVNQSDYSASKFAVVGLMEALSEEMRTAGHDIRFTTICPLTVDTGMNQHPIAKYPILTPILSIPKAAEEILRAIKTEEFIVTLPRREYCFLIGSKLFPRKCFCEVMDFVDYCRMANVVSENSKTNNESTLE